MKAIPGFPGYTISKSGTVKNESGEIVKARKDSDGYQRVDLYNNGKRYTRFVHTLVNEAYGNGGSEVDHKDNDRANNSAGNLEGVSRKENMKRLSKRHRGKK